METLLTLRNASVHYGGVTALSDASFSIDEGEIVALMGPNGAGKTTALKAFFGLTPLSGGEVLWRGERIRPVPHEMAARGIAFIPQGRQVFKSLTVAENLELGGYALRNKRLMAENVELVLEIFPALRPKLGQKAGELSGGQQQMLTIGRGLVSDPRVLLLDEPSLGLAPIIVQEVFDKVSDINRDRKIAVVIVEHSIKSVLAIADRAVVLARGTVVHEGNASELEASGILEKVFLN